MATLEPVAFGVIEPFNQVPVSLDPDNPSVPLVFETQFGSDSPHKYQPLAAVVRAEVQVQSLTARAHRLVADGTVTGVALDVVLFHVLRVSLVLLAAFGLTHLNQSL